MAERFKVADCKSVGFPIVSSNLTSFNDNINSLKFIRNITQSGSVPVLGTGSHVFESHYFDTIYIFLFLNFQ